MKIIDNLNKNRNNFLNHIAREKKSINHTLKDNNNGILNLLKSIEKGIDEDAVVPRIRKLKGKNKALL
ncbi:MAG: hypothetical protein ACUVQN_02080 [Caldisericia bacterium]